MCKPGIFMSGHETEVQRLTRELALALQAEMKHQIAANRVNQKYQVNETYLNPQGDNNETR